MGVRVKARARSSSSVGYNIWPWKWNVNKHKTWRREKSSFMDFVTFSEAIIDKYVKFEVVHKRHRSGEVLDQNTWLLETGK